MKLSLNLFLFFITMLNFSAESFSLTNYQIKKTCRVEKNKSKCLKKLQEKRINLQKGNLIEIPVIPFKR
mgnify:CR=1 FL=1